MQKEVKEQVLNQMIDRIVSLNANLTESEVKDLVADRYLVIRNKNNPYAVYHYSTKSLQKQYVVITATQCLKTF